VNAGKREDRLFFMIQPVSSLPLCNASFFWPGKATAKRDNIKEDVE
jgi:hypothetical protein